MKQLLIVEDEQSLIDAISICFLDENTVQVHSCYTVQEAIAYLQTNTVDVIVLDLIMPDQDGRTLLRYASEHKLNISIIVATNLEDDSIESECLALGAKEVLVKSNTKMTELRATISAYL